MSSVGLYLMTEKGLAVLESALASNVAISHVTTMPATGISDESHVAISEAALAAGVPTSITRSASAIAADYSIAAGWRWMLDVPNLVVLHDSLLPRYRGFSPLITALVNGDTHVGVTAFLAVDEPDAGPVIAQRQILVTYPARMRDVLDRVTPLYAEIAAPILASIAGGDELESAEQDHAQATYSVWRDEGDYRIDWSQSAEQVLRLIDAASAPFPGAWSRDDVMPNRIHAAELEPDLRFEQRHPGKVAFVRDGCPIVVCGTGMIRVLESSFPIPLRVRLT